ncbi:DUF2254 domain-containing protein [Paenisporosarcina cavernae]|uniref:DUF2254 domain-containing protein n=1 Tax=Paenisporosarcina cavernae TaxID=2320858 RepID=A0A385YQJ7_9BACL|nr:DUF2254 domain-containing protein [Paenisporosarcina cavernae]AYC28640.1 DUF2254 domain-containing protein [Paenisporosarcina cavernae]
MNRIVRSLKDGVWVTPGIYSFISLLLVAIFTTIDHFFDEMVMAHVPSIFLTSANLGQTILGGLSAALLTMTTFTFSTVMVVMTTYSSQFSPRTLKNFVRDAIVWRVMGVFMGGFIYTTLSLLFIQESSREQSFLSPGIGIVYAMVCLIYFALFIHHISQNMQVNTLIEHLAIEGESSVKQYEHWTQNLPFASAYNADTTPKRKATPLLARQDGYLQFIEIQEMTMIAKKLNGLFIVQRKIGDFVSANTPVVILYTDEDVDKDAIHPRLFVVGKERDTRQDPVFAIQKMVEVSLRAISPAINDPNTAIHNIHQFGRLLGSYSQLPREEFIFLDEDKVERVMLSIHTFEEMLYHTFYQLSHYAREDISVLSAMTETLIVAAESAPVEAKKDIWTVQMYLIESIDFSSLQTLDRQYFQLKINRLARSVGEQPIKFS